MSSMEDLQNTRRVRNLHSLVQVGPATGAIEAMEQVLSLVEKARSFHSCNTCYRCGKGRHQKTHDRYRVPKFPHSSATFNILSGFHILASPKVLQGAFGDSACPMRCSQPRPMLANRHLTGLTWFPIVLYYIK